VDRRQILIADDEPSLRMLVGATISSGDYDVIEAADGTEALALIEQHHPSIAILDVQMPGKTGVEVTEIVKGTDTLKDTFVILLTSKSLDADRAAGLAAGADRYLTKPFSPMELLSVLEGALEVL